MAFALLPLGAGLFGFGLGTIYGASLHPYPYAYPPPYAYPYPYPYPYGGYRRW
ncbi:hypothetical protein CEB3_c07160 [Peptococcaceae bacterium CEB3]|nr:hypothetical protein CEB3_c07160 [Peptococcaceae bacterium CEB3]